MKMFISLVFVLTLFCKGVMLTGPQYFPFPFYTYFDYESDSQEFYRPVRRPPAFAGHGHGYGNIHGHGNGHNYGHGNRDNYGHGNGNNHGNSGHWPPGFGPGHNKKGHGPPHGGGGEGSGNQNGHGHKNNKEPPFPATIPTRTPGVTIKPKPTVQATTSTPIDNSGKGLIDVRFGETDTETRKKRSTNSADKSTTELQLRFNSLHQFPNRNTPDRDYQQFSNHYPRLATCVQKKFECIPLDECKTASYTNAENRFCRFGHRGPYVCCERQKIEKLHNFAIKCGGRKKNAGLSQAIIGGINVDGGGGGGNYPWMTAIGENVPNGSVDWYCGGALINEKTVITAAHCISRRQADVVRVGETDLSINKTDANSNLQQIPICRSLIHPLFRLPQLYNDLALLFLDTPVQFTPFVKPICLSQQMTSETPLAILTGWGQLSFASEQSPILQEVRVQVFNNTYCDDQYALTQASKRNFPRGVLETQLCAGDENGGKDACQGDSGAPLVAEEDEGFALIGIVSAGIGCGSKIFPGVYTRVASFTPWIFENLD